MIRKELNDHILEAMKRLGVSEETGVSLSRTDDPSHGDYATNAALVLSKRMNENPKELAERLSKEIQDISSDVLEKVEVAGPGFINLFLSQKTLRSEADKAKVPGYSINDSKIGQKVMIEFTDPNPFKEFHIGHLYTNSVGESLARLFEASSADVRRANYQGDVGMHVAKAIWGLQRSVGIEEIKGMSVKERVEFLGKAYAKGASGFEDDEIKKEIEQLNKKIFEGSDPDVMHLYETGRSWSLEYFETLYERLGTKFDHYYFERDAADKGIKIVRDGIEKGVFEESQGAVIFPGEKYGLHSRVFINSQGLPTYEAKELGLAPTKYEDFKYDLSVIVTGNEVSEYFRVLKKALSELFPELGERTLHIGHGMVRLPEGKMASRTGSVITAEQLLDGVKERAIALFDMNDELAEHIALGAIKYSFLRISIGKDIIFNVDSSLSMEGDSGPYIQYTHARCKSILSSVDEKGDMSKGGNSLEEQAVLKQLCRFPEVVEEATRHMSPSLVCNYVTELARSYNAFYNKHRVLQAETDDDLKFRLGLTEAVAQVLRDGLKLLGIHAPDRM